MSIVCMGWVLRNSEATLGQRLVLLALSDFADEDGCGAWPSVSTLATHSRLSTRQVQYALRALEDSGQIVKTGTSKAGCNVYRVVMERGGANIAGGAVECTGGVQPIAPDPSLEPSVELTPSVVSPAGDVVLARKRYVVDRKTATDDEVAVASSIKFFWNRLSEQNLTADTWITMFVRRCREHPEMTIDDHVLMIETVLADPWWDGPPSPNLIYGNAQQFERCIEQVRAKLRGEPQGKQPLRYGRGMTTRQILDTFGGEDEAG